MKKELKTETLTSVPNDEQVLRACIEKAEKNGFDIGKVMPAFPLPGFKADKFFNSMRNEIIFDHEFAKAFFGEESVYDEDGMPKEGFYNIAESPYLVWQYHIAELAKAKDRIDYLRRFLDE